MQTLLAQDLAAWHDWVNSGALAAFAVFVCWVIYRVITHGGVKAFELGERYVRSTESLHDTLQSAEQAREKLCESHAKGLENMTLAVAVGNDSLKQLVDIHRNPDSPVMEAVQQINEGSADVQRFKLAALQACRMCREISQKEIPNSANEVAKHCDEIERVIGEA